MSNPAEWLPRAAARNPGQIALRTPDHALTYGELWPRVARGPTPPAGSAPAAVDGAGPVELFLATHLALAHGFPLLPLGPHLDATERGHLMQVSGAAPWAADLPSRLAGEAPDAPPPPPAFAGRPADGRNAQLYIATSGTTGLPKAVMLSPANLAAAVAASSHLSRLAPGDTWLGCLPLYHIGGLSIVLRCAAAAATVLLHHGFDPARVLEDLARHRVTHVSLVPPMLARLLEAASGPPPRGLRMVLTGGGPLDEALCREAVARGWPVCPTYGMSEAASQVATRCPAPADWHQGDVGRPLPGVRVDLVDDQGRPVANEGLIRVRGTNVMLGYADGSGGRGRGLDPCGAFVTGDRGRLAADGSLTVLGRADEVAVTGGVNVHPAQVERRLVACPGIESVSVRAEPHPLWGSILAADVVGPWDVARIEGWCRDHLPAALRPRRWRVAPSRGR